MQSITLQTSDSAITSSDILGRLNFAASSEADGGAAILQVGSIYAMAEGTFSSAANPASIVFATSASDTSAAQDRIKITHEGNILPITNNAYDLGSTSLRFKSAHTNALTINNAYSFPTSDGSSNQVLQTDGAGNLSFATVSGGGGETNEFSFKTISVAGQSDVVADTTTDTLTLAAGSNVTITTDASTDTITFAATDTNTQLSTEEVQDIAGPLVATGGTKTLITVTYDDANGNMDFVVDDDLSNYDNTTSGFLTAHPNISAASSSDNSGRTYIQDILLDSNGHVTGITTATETVTDTNTTYSAGTNISLAGTTFNVDDAFLVNNADDTTSGTVTMANLIVGDAGNIGSASDTDAIAIASDGEVTLSQRSTFSKAIKTPLQSNTDGTTVTFNLNEANTHTVTLGGNRTLAISNETAGQKFIINLVQDGTGSRTVTWFSTIKWAGGSAPTLTSTANKADSFGFLCTGTDAYYGFVIGQNI